MMDHIVIIRNFDDFYDSVIWYSTMFLLASPCPRARCPSGHNWPSKTSKPKLERSRVVPQAELHARETEAEIVEYMAKMATRVNQAIDEAVPLRHPVDVHQAMRYSLFAGGERVRPILCLAACDLVGGDEEAAIPTACALEMIHTTSLIQDDLLSRDNNDFRRRKQANHKALDKAIAILAGIALTSLAFEHIVSKSKSVEPDSVVRVIAELGKAAGADGTVGGQVVDMISAGEQIGITGLEYVQLKKAAVLIQASVVCGAIMGGGSAADVDRLCRYGRCIGLLYQVVEPTYSKVLGKEKAQELANVLVIEAHKELSHYDRVKAAPLYRIADNIAHRSD